MWPFLRKPKNRCDHCRETLDAERIHTGGGDAYCTPRCAALHFGLDIEADGRVVGIIAEELTVFATLDDFLRSGFYHFRREPVEQELPHAG